MTEIYDSANTTELIEDPIVKLVQDHVLKTFNVRYDPRLVYHNFQRFAKIDLKIQELGKNNKYSPNEIQIARIAAWFKGAGIVFDYKKPVPRSLEQAKNFLGKIQYAEDKIQKVLISLNDLGDKNKIIQPSIQLLSDAVNSFAGEETYEEHRPLLRLEWELYSNRHLSNIEWAQEQLQTLINTRFYTPAAKIQMEPVLAKNIRFQKQKLEKLKRNKGLIEDEEGRLQKFQNIERRMPERGTQTFFRANYRNHINLSAIADTKANIMISVNAIMLSVLISLLTYKNITDTNPIVLLPVVIFLVTGLTSLIYAVLSIRPKVTSLNTGPVSTELAKQNIVFFGNFVTLKLEQYEEAMDAMLRDSQLMYGNMTRDLYYLGKVLEKKYRYLTISYNIFMLGFAAVVLTFLITLLTS